MKTKIILSGACGRMGKAIRDAVELTDNCEIVAGVDVNASGSLPYPLYTSFADIKESGDVIVQLALCSTMQRRITFPLS